MHNIRHKSLAALLAALFITASGVPTPVWADTDPAPATANEEQPVGTEPSADAADAEAPDTVATDTPELQAPPRTGSFDNFRAQNQFTADTFSDVAESDWFYSSVQECYMLNLISGRPEGRFDPYDSVSLAEAISMAARLHSIYYATDTLQESTGGAWYEGAVNYVVAQGIIDPNTFYNYEKAATRAELAYIFHQAFAQADLKIVNNVTALPDVLETTPYYEAIYKLYNVGILSGNDEYGTFHPANNITRGETAVLLNRLAVPSRRQTLSLTPFERSLWNTPFASADGLFNVSASMSWNAGSSKSSAQSVLELETYPAERKISAFTVAKSSLPYGLDTDFTNYHNQLAQDLSGGLKSSQIHSTDALQVDGRNALLSHVTGKESGVSFYYWLLTIDQGDHFVLLTGCTSQADAPEAGAEIIAILTSCQFVDPLAENQGQEASSW